MAASVLVASRIRSQRGISAVALVAVSLALSACTGTSSDTDGAAEPPIGPAVVQRLSGVGYNDACPEAPVVVDGRVYYPLPADQLAGVDPDWYHASTESVATATIMEAPDPVVGRSGELIVFADGVAEFVDYDGNVIWLTLVVPDGVDPPPTC